MSETTDKNSLTATFNPNGLPNAAVGGAKNVIAQIVCNAPVELCQQFSMNWYVGIGAPDSTAYPDAEAPIGSLYFSMSLTGAAVSGAKVYQKTAASTWTVLGAES